MTDVSRLRCIGPSLFGLSIFALGLTLADASPTPSNASVSCATVAACIFGTNVGTGPAIEGSSVSGFAIEGISTSGRAVSGSSQTNIGVVGSTYQNATSAGTGKAGVSGYDDSTNRNTFNSGVYGVSAYGDGLQGRSTSGTGVFGMALSSGVGMQAVAGTMLFAGFQNVGLAAQSASGAGLIAVGSGTGVVGFQTGNCLNPDNTFNCANPLQNEIPGGAAVTGGTDQGGLGLNIETDDNPYLDAPTRFFQGGGVGGEIVAGSVGLYVGGGSDGHSDPALVVNGQTDLYDGNGANTFQGAIISGYNALSVTGSNDGIVVSAPIGLFAQSPGTGGTLFEGAASDGTDVAKLDDRGNLTLAGTLTIHGTIKAASRNTDGSYSASYLAHSTTPVVDDMGETTLREGSSYVAIDPAFAKSIDLSHGYLVFLTPQGPTTGLYVANKSAAGFAVREIGNARGSIAFDYRIVAHPYGEHGARLAPTNIRISAAIGSKAVFYRHLKAPRFKHGRLDRASLPHSSM